MEDKMRSFNTQLIEVPEAGSKKYGGETIIKELSKYFRAKFEKAHRTPNKIIQHLETLYQNYKTSKIKWKQHKATRGKAGYK